MTKRGLLTRSSAVAAAILLSGCGVHHQIQTLPGPGKNVKLVVDYTTGFLSAHGALVTVTAQGGPSIPIAVFRNVQSINVTWLDPEDVAICEIGDVVDHKTHVVVGGLGGGQVIFVQYKCPMI